MLQTHATDSVLARRGHGDRLSYLRDPDNHLIEVGQLLSPPS